MGEEGMRPAWAEGLPGEIMGTDWGLYRRGDAASHWGVVWDTETGRVTGVEIATLVDAANTDASGDPPRRSLRLGTALAESKSDADAVRELIRATRSTDGRLVELFAVLAVRSAASSET